MSAKVFGIDFGTSTIKIYRKNEGVIFDEKNIIALCNNEVMAIGDEAFEMLENIIDEYYFEEMTVDNIAEKIRNSDFLNKTFVYDDAVVKGFIKISGNEIEKLFVEPVLQGQGIGKKLLCYAVHNCGAEQLWVLEKNSRATAFYQRNGFYVTDEKKPEEDTDEYLVLMKKA